ncbi:DUF6021 family protein [Pseudomonas sp. MAFF 302030]|jgi:hypothetical protein|uniref:DUF6021 family protein n=1 Tax=Pseudomonas morbosilactucae TaxID=2938197 RepID=A0A9X1Z1S4_9PSED|nr:DUF6021 family protein [Pseudomonas morbosilactucae]MCK9802036.1 DUF6021 family protein [Pseudomonas morbosilactucae]
MNSKTPNSQTPSGPSSSEHASGQDELGFDPDSPDLADPQVDPIGPAKAPLDPDPQPGKTERSKAYDPLANLRR